MSEQAGNYQLSDKSILARGFAYRGEIILVLAYEIAVLWPTWLNGLQVAFANEATARAFVDAHSVWVLSCNAMFAGVQ